MSLSPSLLYTHTHTIYYTQVHTRWKVSGRNLNPFCECLLPNSILAIRADIHVVQGCRFKMQMKEKNLEKFPLQQGILCG